MESCCCPCLKSKRKVNNDPDPSKPLLAIEGEKNNSNKQVRKKDPYPARRRSSLLARNSIGELDIDSSDGSLSDLSGGVPDPPGVDQTSLMSSVGAIKIPDEVLNRDKSLRTLKSDVSSAAAKISSKRNAEQIKQIKRVHFEEDEGVLATKLGEVKVKESKEKKKEYEAS